MKNALLLKTVGYSQQMKVNEAIHQHHNVGYHNIITLTT